MFVLRALLCGMALVAVAPAGAAGGCRFDGPSLLCTDGDPTLAEAVRRFASEETAQTLERETADFAPIRDLGAREHYRQSLEQNNERAIRFLARADRESRTGRIDAATYGERLATYRRALENYRLGMDRYYAAYWFDPVPERPPHEPEAPGAQAVLSVRG